MGIKHELELFREELFVEHFPPRSTSICEHPVNLQKGERSRSFVRGVRELRYGRILLFPDGVPLSSARIEKIITISGSIALEAVSSGKGAVVIKNTHLVMVDGVRPIGELIHAGDLEIVVQKQVSPANYILACEAGCYSENQAIDGVLTLFSRTEDSGELSISHG